MKLVISDETGVGGPPSERTFENRSILIGRDALECDISFDRDRYPMVSRRHAEIRLQNDRYFLVDLNSSYGTFLEGQKVTAPVELAHNSLITIGASGPTLRVVSTGADLAVHSPAAGRQNAFQYSENSSLATPGSSSSSGQTEVLRNQRNAARLFFISENAREPIDLSRTEICLGRDPSCDIIFEASAVMVSRKHAFIRNHSGDLVLDDNNSFNGTLLNGQRISASTPLYDGDQIQLGLGGPIVRIDAPARIAPSGASLAGQRSISINQIIGQSSTSPISSQTMVFQMGRDSRSARSEVAPQLLMSLNFGDKKELSIGRGDINDIKLDGLQISTRHARLIRSGSEIIADDLGSTNGIYVNGSRVSRQSLSGQDALQIGSFIIRVDSAGNVGVFDTRSKTRIDAVNLCRDVKSKFGQGRITLLDSVSLSIQPNEFVGLLGPSGSGKSTLIDALNGVRPARGGNVLINDLDLYRHFDSLKQSIGYVPQDDVIHRELTVYRTLYYTARLRLSRDVSKSEINQTINEILDVTGLAERRHVPVNQLSGGQRKRVSIAVELITKPSVIFLDEPTSGLDPATEEKIMKLFRQIAESGRTVVMTTHAMENVRLFDKVVVLMRGKLVFYGTPAEALKHFSVKTYKELYDKLDEPVEREVSKHGEESRREITEHVANEWKQKFLQTSQYQNNIKSPLASISTLQHSTVYKKRRLGFIGAVRQWLTLSRRYVEVLTKDKLNLFILFVQAPLIALMTFLVMGSELARDFVYFVLSLVAIWFGTSVAAREIIRERPVFRRERMVNLGIMPYLGSKLFILGAIVAVQCLLLFVPLKLLDLAGIMAMPGELFGLPQLWAMLLTAGLGIGLGLFISALVRTSEMATSLVPLLLIPQILFSGLFGVPTGLNRVVGLTMPAAWSFDTMKRFSTLDTLEPEGAEPDGPTRGKGLYQYTKDENTKIIDNARKSIDDYKKDAETKFREYDRQIRNGETPAIPHPDEPAAVPDPKQVPSDLSHYIVFLHPWMNEVLNQIVLMLMFGILVIATLIVLKLQDVG